MKTIYLIIALFLISACNSLTPIPREENCDSVKCVVTKIKKEYRYPGTLPDYYWKIETTCGYTLTSNCEYSIGDTIIVKIISSTNSKIYN
jgi:hypothetical protein